MLMHGKPLLGPINNTELRGEDTKKSLGAMNLIKENDVGRSRGEHVKMRVNRKGI